MVLLDRLRKHGGVAFLICDREEDACWKSDWVLEEKGEESACMFLIAAESENFGARGSWWFGGESNAG